MTQGGGLISTCFADSKDILLLLLNLAQAKYHINYHGPGVWRDSL